MAGVSIQNVEKSFGGVRVIHGIDIEIEHGAFVVLVGPSGCGKSTLLRLIAGLEDVTDGAILIGHQEVNDMAPKDRDIAMVFQNYGLYPHMTVAQNMGFALKLFGEDKAAIAKRVEQAASILNLDALLECYPRQLSGGQRQRVAMGRAIVRNPQVFLFDEPLSNLDAKLRVQMRAEIKQLHQRLKVTTVYVTHDQIEAMTMADVIVVMHDGVVKQAGSPLDLYDRPANLFVAGFIGSPAMNLIEAVVKSGALVFADGQGLPVPDGVDLAEGTGVSDWDEDFTPDIDHPIVVEAAEYFVDLAKNTAPREAQNRGFLEGLDMFRDGRLATATMWPQGVGTVEAEDGDAAGNTGYSPLPVWEDNLAGYTQGTPFLGGGGLFVFDTPNSEEAFKFLKWMLQDNEIEWGKQSEQFSRKGHFASDELRNLKPYYADFLPAYETVLESVFIRQGIPEYGSVMWNGTTEFITDTFSGDLSAEQAQDRWVRSMTDAFRRAGYIE